MAGQSFLNRLSDWTLSFWFNPSVVTNGTLYSEGGPEVTMNVSLTAQGQLHVGVWNKTKSGSSYWANDYHRRRRAVQSTGSTSP